jgi:hypothetical protein
MAMPHESDSLKEKFKGFAKHPASHLVKIISSSISHCRTASVVD